VHGREGGGGARVKSREFDNCRWSLVRMVGTLSSSSFSSGRMPGVLRGRRWTSGAVDFRGTW